MLNLYWRLVFQPYWLQIIVIAGSIFLTSTLAVISIGMIVPVVGVLQGFSLLTLASVVRDNGKGWIEGLDLFEAYPYNHEQSAL